MFADPVENANVVSSSFYRACDLEKFPEIPSNLERTTLNKYRVMIICWALDVRQTCVVSIDNRVPDTALYHILFSIERKDFNKTYGSGRDIQRSMLEHIEALSLCVQYSAMAFSASPFGRPGH